MRTLASLFAPESKLATNRARGSVARALGLSAGTSSTLRASPTNYTRRFGTPKIKSIFRPPSIDPTTAKLAAFLGQGRDAICCRRHSSPKWLSRCFLRSRCGSELFLHPRTMLARAAAHWDAQSREVEV